MTERTLRIQRVERATLEIPDPDGGPDDYLAFAVRIGADLDVDVLAAIMELQMEIRRYGRKESKIPDWVRRSKRLIGDVIREAEPTFDADERLALSPSQVLQVLTFLGGSADVGAEVVAPELAAAPGAGNDETTADPTTSQRGSRSRRSRSEKRSTSDRAGGEESAGASSSSISATPTAA